MDRACPLSNYSATPYRRRNTSYISSYQQMEHPCGLREKQQMELGSHGTHAGFLESRSRKNPGGTESNSFGDLSQQVRSCESCTVFSPGHSIAHHKGQIPFV